MRFSLLVLLAAVAVAGAQQPAGKAPHAPPASNPKLDNYLLRWEQEMKKVNTLEADIARLDKDKTFGTSTKYVGKAQYMKAGNGPSALNLATLELRQEGKAEIADKIICTGTYLYQFFPPQKEIKAYELPKPKPGQVSDDGFLGLMFGMKSEDAKKRFVLSLYKEDAHYIYVDITPRFPADKSDFSRAQLVLMRETFLPRRLWFEQGNGSEVTWDLPRLKVGAEVNRASFDPPRPPEGWKLVPQPRTSSNSPANAPGGAAAPPPRVIRPNDK